MERTHSANDGFGKLGTMNGEHPTHTSRRLPRLILALIAVAGILAMLGIAYIWFTGGSGQPSSATSAPALSVAAGDTRSLFQIVPEESVARFIITEELLGAPKTVIGVTDQVAGDMLIDLDDPTSTELGTIRINVRTLATDNEIRNRALRGQILHSDREENEFAQFTPTALIGLPDSIAIGTPISFQIVGDLTVGGVTREVTFEAEVMPVSETRLEGAAQAVVFYQDFGITIPEAPGVANVSDDVRLEIDFVAALAVE
ncbi:MAG: YceI family protein [Anaerolineae bacterium]|nr:YceI family protein [Anaerolineae bacterium]